MLPHRPEETKRGLRLERGTVVAGRFRLERLLGEGGMGSVWLARQVELAAPCAIKFAHPEVAADAELCGRFEREAKAAAQLRSLHVVHVFDYGITDGVPFLV